MGATVRLIARRAAWIRVGIVVLLVGLAAAVPQLGSSFYVSVAISVLIFGLLAMSLDLLAGYTGLVSLGHASFLGVAAYSVAYATARGVDPIVATGFALVVVLAVAALFGLIAVRVKEITFVMLTLALGQIIWGLAYRWTSVLGGDNGLPIAARPALGPIDLTDTSAYYYVALVIFIICAFLLWRIVNSPFGLALQGIRENEPRMRTLGFNVGLHKYLAFVVASVFAGIAGVLFAFFNLYMSPTAIDFAHNGNIVLMTVVGGLGTLWGPLIGAALIVLAQQYLSIYVTRWVTVLGVVFVLTVLFARSGLYGTARQGLRWLIARYGSID